MLRVGKQLPMPFWDSFTCHLYSAQLAIQTSTDQKVAIVDLNVSGGMVSFSKTMADITKNPIFRDETAARRFLKELRWPQGVQCAHCGAFGDDISKVEIRGTHTVKNPKGGRHRPAREGLSYCTACDKQFTVTVGTVMGQPSAHSHAGLCLSSEVLVREECKRA